MAAGVLSGQVALVTGASRGVGRAIAEALASEGAAIGLLARSHADLRAVARGIGERGGAAVAVPADVTDAAAVTAAVARVTDELGPVDLLVSNAGTFDALGPLAATDPAVWWHDLEVHVRGAVLCARAVLPGMLTRGAGRIVNIVGMLGQDGRANVSAYACAKAALLRLTDTVATETRGTGVVAFAVSPGLVRTAMTERLAEPGAAADLPVFQDIPEEAWEPPDRVGRLMVRLAAGAADALSGRYLHVGLDLDALIADSDKIAGEDLLALRVRTLTDPQD